MDTVMVRMAEIKVVEEEGRGKEMKTTLGSCVGIVLSDVKKGIHGMAHVMLPKKLREDQIEGKYAETAIPALVKRMEEKGSKSRDMEAYIVGGACMFESFSGNGTAKIGEKNVEATRRILGELGIRIVYEETGGNSGRTLIFDSGTCQIKVKSLKKLEAVRV